MQDLSALDRPADFCTKRISISLRQSKSRPAVRLHSARLSAPGPGEWVHQCVRCFSSLDLLHLRHRGCKQTSQRLHICTSDCTFLCTYLPQDLSMLGLWHTWPVASFQCLPSRQTHFPSSTKHKHSYFHTCFQSPSRNQSMVESSQ